MAMTEDDYRHFVCIVAGEAPDELLRPYNATIDAEPYIKFKKDDASKILKMYIKTYEGYLDNPPKGLSYDIIEDTIDDLKNMSAGDFFKRLSINEEVDSEGNILSRRNPNGKYKYCNVGKLFSIPFITKDGKEAYSSQKKDIDWNKVHGGGEELYKRAWEMVMEHSEPKTETDHVIFNNMKDMVGYLTKFETKENYVTSNTAFWGYAFLSDTTGWMDASKTQQFEWMKNYYDVFIKPLPEDTLLTIYECHI